MFECILFYCFAAGLVISSILMISIRNSVYAALFLILCFVFSAAIWLLLHAEFLGMILILVYVGAVTVLILFVVMMLNSNRAVIKEGFLRYVPLVLLFTLVFIGTLTLIINSGLIELQGHFDSAIHYTDNNTAALGRLLYSDYLYPFEIAGALLLLAIIAAISLTAHAPRSNKIQNPAEQVHVKAADRMRIVDLKPDEMNDDA